MPPSAPPESGHDGEMQRRIDAGSTSSDALGASIVGWCRLEYPRGDAVFGRRGPAQLLIVARLIFRGRHVANGFEQSTCNRPGSQVFDVYASVVGEDGYFGPGALVPEFSSPGRDTRIFIRKDGLEVSITSDRTGGQGLIDIWTSTRETLSDPWPTPSDVPSPVNSACDDGSPWLSRDGTTLYFFSSRAGLECGKRDIWYATRVKIDQENTAQAMVASFWNRMLAGLAGTSH
jgi:hypothetical protein